MSCGGSASRRAVSRLEEPFAQVYQLDEVEPEPSEVEVAEEPPSKARTATRSSASQKRGYRPPLRALGGHRDCSASPMPRESRNTWKWKPIFQRPLAVLDVRISN